MNQTGRPEPKQDAASGHASANASSQLIFHLDHSMRAAQAIEPRSPTAHSWPVSGAFEIRRAVVEATCLPDLSLDQRITDIRSSIEPHRWQHHYIASASTDSTNMAIAERVDDAPFTIGLEEPVRRIRVNTVI
jgi:hypothetical protein